MTRALKKFMIWPARCLAVSLGSAAAQAKVSVAAISGYFAQGFGVSIVNGLNKAKDDFGIDLKLVDTGNRALDYEEQFDNLAKGGQYDLIFVMGWELVDALQKASAAYPDQRFVFIDGVLDSPKMIYANFAEEQGSFVAGALAGLIEAKGSEFDKIGDGKAIGFVGGRDIPVIRNFLGGYEQGAKYAAPDVKVNSVFAGTFDDPAKGSELAHGALRPGLRHRLQRRRPDRRRRDAGECRGRQVFDRRRHRHVRHGPRQCARPAC